MSRRSLFAAALAAVALLAASMAGVRAQTAAPGPDDPVDRAEYAQASARALLDHSAILAVGTVTAQRIEQRNGHVYTLQTMAVQKTLRGTLPAVITVRVEGGRLPDGSWEDVESFALPAGGPVLFPLHPLGAPIGIDPQYDGTYRLNQRLLGTILQEGALQPTEAAAQYGLPAGTCDACENLVAQIDQAVADASATVDDAIYNVLTTATLPSTTACGVTPVIGATRSEGPAGVDVAADTTEVADITCGAAGGASTGGYTFFGEPWWSRYLPANYKVWNNTKDVTGEELAVQSGAESWDAVGTWFKSTYTGVTSSAGTSVVYWTPHDIDALARGGNNGAHGAAGFTIYFGDQYCFSVGAKVNCYDIASVTRHEMGHVLGLGHSPYKRNVMFFQMPSNTVKGLGPDDIAGLRYLYPAAHYRGAITGQSHKALTVLAGTGSTDVTVSFVNQGRTPWNMSRNIVERTDVPFGRCSVFSGSGASLPKALGLDGFKPWTSCSQPTARIVNPAGYTTVEPGEAGQVTFRFNAPLTTTPGTVFTENFTLDVAGTLSLGGNTKHSFTITVL